MSAIGPKRTSLIAPHTSAFGGKADIIILTAYKLACELRRYLRISEAPSDVVAAALVAPPLASVGLNPVAPMKFVYGV
jgi:hypothetical protein